MTLDCHSVSVPSGGLRSTSREREEEALALRVAERLEHGVVDGDAVEAALLRRDEDLVEQREDGALVVDAAGEHPAQHAAVDLHLLEAVARVGRQPHLPE